MAKARWKSAATAEERAENGVKDVVKMVAFCGQKFNCKIDTYCGVENLV